MKMTKILSFLFVLLTSVFMVSCSENETEGFNAIEGNMPTINSNTSGININNIYGEWCVNTIDGEILDYEMYMNFMGSGQMITYVFEDEYQYSYSYNWTFNQPNQIVFTDEEYTFMMTIERLTNNELILIDDSDSTIIVASKI